MGKAAYFNRSHPGVYARRVDPQNPAEIANRLIELRREHRELDHRIRNHAAETADDELSIKRLKKRKLWLKDCIARLESALIPDEPA